SCMSLLQERTWPVQAGWSGSTMARVREREIDSLLGSGGVLARHLSSIEDRLVVRPSAVTPRADGVQEEVGAAELVVAQRVDPLVQRAAWRAAKDQGERLGPRRPRPGGQGVRLDELQGDRDARLVVGAELRADPLCEIRQLGRPKVHRASVLRCR